MHLPRGRVGGAGFDGVLTHKNYMQKTHWPSTGSYRHIVDLSPAANRAFSRISSWPERSEVSVFCSVEFNEEPKNTYGTIPIAITLNEAKIGNLSRFHIDEYHAASARAGVQGKRTTAHAKVTRTLTQKGKEQFTLGVDICFFLQPGTFGARKLKPAYDYQVPYFHSIATIRDGFLIMVMEGVDPETVNKCTPGRDVDCWSPEGSKDIYLYAEGSVGGSGKIAVTDTDILAAGGFHSADDFHPVIHSAGGDVVIVVAKVP